jgi:hypothetical protein
MVGALLGVTAAAVAHRRHARLDIVAGAWLMCGPVLRVLGKTSRRPSRLPLSSWSAVVHMRWGVRALCSKLCSRRVGKRRIGTGQDGIEIGSFQAGNREIRRDS